MLKEKEEYLTYTYYPLRWVMTSSFNSIDSRLLLLSLSATILHCRSFLCYSHLQIKHKNLFFFITKFILFCFYQSGERYGI